jgi:hypothetical protein
VAALEASQAEALVEAVENSIPHRN